MKHSRPKILSVGALTYDTIFRFDQMPDGPGKFLPLETVQNASGMAASAAVAACLAGGDVALWASVGDDLTGNLLIADMERTGVDCSAVRQVAGGRSAIATILVDNTAERLVVADYDPVTQAPPTTIPNFTDFDVVMADVRWPAAAEYALRGARKAGKRAILDADVAEASILEMLAPLATHIAASETGAQFLAGKALSPADAVQALKARFSAEIIVTAGADGAYWFDRTQGQVRHSPTFPVTPVDTLAAGDVFHGAFAVALAEGQPLDAAIRFGSAAAALKCQVFGGRRGAPNRAAIQQLLSQ